MVNLIPFLILVLGYQLINFLLSLINALVCLGIELYGFLKENFIFFFKNKLTKL